MVPITRSISALAVVLRLGYPLVVLNTYSFALVYIASFLSIFSPECVCVVLLRSYVDVPVYMYKIVLL